VAQNLKQYFFNGGSRFEWHDSPYMTVHMLTLDEMPVRDGHAETDEYEMAAMPVRPTP
jgi:hypothetical protein